MIMINSIKADGAVVWRYSECLHCLKEDESKRSVLLFFLTIGSDALEAEEIAGNILAYPICADSYYATHHHNRKVSVRVKGIDVEVQITV